MAENLSTYRTIETPGTGEYKEKGSRFVGLAVRCKSEQEVKEWLIQWKSEHHQSRHLCYAWRLGSAKNRFRANDDGEPSNSAGAPILGQIQSFDVTNVLVGVVRYYGGVKLGVGGLIHAYRIAAREALEQAEIVETEDELTIELLFAYDQMPAVMNIVKAIPLIVSEQQFELNCRLVCYCPVSKKESVRQLQGIEGLELIEHGIKE